MRNSCQKCGTHLPFFPGIKKPRRPRSTGLSNVEAEAGIEPAWADLQSTVKVAFFQLVTRISEPHLCSYRQAEMPNLEPSGFWMRKRF